MHEINLEHTTDTGHRIVGHKGKCARLHGHTYRWLVKLRASKLTDPGFVVDFGDIKDLLNEWDHRVLLWEKDMMSVAFGPPILKLNRQVTEDEMLRIRKDLAEAVATKSMMVLPSDIEYTAVDEQDTGVIRVPFNPTAENMVQHMIKRIVALVEPPCTCELVVYETPKSSARAEWVQL